MGLNRSIGRPARPLTLPNCDIGELSGSRKAVIRLFLELDDWLRCVCAAGPELPLIDNLAITKKRGTCGVVEALARARAVDPGADNGERFPRAMGR